MHNMHAFPFAVNAFCCLFVGNAHTLNLVDTALFCLAFEDSDSVDPFKLSRLFLCGDAASRLLMTLILNGS